MRRAKIVCTIGPASSSPTTLGGLMEAGMDVARLNMSHGDHASHGKLIELIRRVSGEQGREVAILLDLAGPKIRIGELSAPVDLEAGDTVRLTTREVVGEGNLLPVRYPYLTSELKTGDGLSIHDGLILLEVTGTGPDELVARVLQGGRVLSRKGVNLPTGGDGLDALTQKDEADLRFGLRAGVDWVGLSFVRKPSDADRVREIMAEEGITLPLMAKIEKRQALDNLDAILAAFDGLMVARGDLGVEVSLEELPGVQKEIIRKANRASKPVVTATQMLLSMVENQRPTRAEVTDVANAIVDGTDAVMLSEETAMGAHPVETVRMMSRIADHAARIQTPCPLLGPGAPLQNGGTSAAIARSTKTVADEIGAKVIMTPTATGRTPRLISSTRPAQPVVALVTTREVVRQLALSWGVAALHMPEMHDTDSFFEACARLAGDRGLAARGDPVVVTAGVPLGSPGSTNMLRVLKAP